MIKLAVLACRNTTLTNKFFSAEHRHTNTHAMFPWWAWSVTARFSELQWFSGWRWETREGQAHTHTHTHRLGSIYLRIRFRPLFNCASVSGSVSTAHSHQAGAFTAVTPRHQHWRQPDHHSQTQSLAVFYSRAICLQLKRELNRWPCTYQTPSV